MGVVFKARHRRLNRLVAVKMIRAGAQAGPEDLVRFRFEAEAVARLRHAHIVQIYDIGEVAGLPFVSLELLDGGTLADRLAGTPQPGRPAAELVVTLARAMHAAHRLGIVHRDLKPSNVLFDRDGTPKIADFGLAKRLEQEDGQTETGQIVGTPSYMAPEQARGQTREVGPAVDVYALGAILYEMLTGRPPFKAPTPLETARQVIEEEPVAPLAPAIEGPARPGDDLPEVPGQGAAPAVRRRRSPGRRPGSLPGGRADPRPADSRLGTGREVGPAAADGRHRAGARRRGGRGRGGSRPAVLRSRAGPQAA
jgi:serine/threonine protein kinase